MKLIKCGQVTAEIFGQKRMFYVPADCTIEEVTTALQEITETAHLSQYRSVDVTPQEYNSNQLFNTVNHE